MILSPSRQHTQLSAQRDILSPDCGGELCCECSVISPQAEIAGSNNGRIVNSRPEHATPTNVWWGARPAATGWRFVAYTSILSPCTLADPSLGCALGMLPSDASPVSIPLTRSASSLAGLNTATFRDGMRSRLPQRDAISSQGRSTLSAKETGHEKA